MGLIREGDGVAARVLTSMGVDIKDVRSQIEMMIGTGPFAIQGPIGYTPRAKRVMELAMDESLESLGIIMSAQSIFYWV